MIKKSFAARTTSLLCGLLAAGIASGPVAAQPQGAPAALATSATGSGTLSGAAHPSSPYHSEKLTERAKQLYAGVWGIDTLKVSYTSSGNLIRFSYRVLDPVRAKPLADKKSTPYMLGQKSHALLQVPVMEKIGALRQAAPPEAGQDYWMVFSNKGHPIKPGDRVNVMIGTFHADGLMVE
jgi:hypothetical protein